MEQADDWADAEINSASPPVLMAFPPHPDRSAAIQEPHARPSLGIISPCVVYHLALGAANEAAVDAIHQAAFGEPQEGYARHVMRVSGPLTTKFERHTEFVSLTIMSRDGPDSGEAPLRRLRQLRPPGLTVLVGLRLFVVAQPAEPFSPLDIGGRLRGDVEISTSLRPETDGFINIQLATGPVGPEQLGRRVQRLLEAETYRTMALLGLPLARRIGSELAELEAKLVEITNTLTEKTGSDQEILDRIQALSAQTEAMRARTRYRFSASRAYAALVDERLDALGEAKIGERPTLSGFLRTRLAPAMRTIVSAEARLDELSAAVGRALALLRARVDVSLDEANQDILRSMNERQYRQLILSEAVESLSVIAISYYFLGILSYPVKALKETGLLPISEIVALGILAPFVALGVFAILRLLRKRWLPD